MFGRLAIAALVLLCGGCATSQDCGSKTIVGDYTALPRLSSDAADTDIEVYRSIQGASVYTRKDSRVVIDYTNAYTNTLFGLWDKIGAMTLRVTIEPTEAGGEEEATPQAQDE